MLMERLAFPQMIAADILKRQYSLRLLADPEGRAFLPHP